VSLAECTCKSPDASPVGRGVEQIRALWKIKSSVLGAKRAVGRRMLLLVSGKCCVLSGALNVT